MVTPGWGRPLAMALVVSGGMGARAWPWTNRAAFSPAAWPWTETKSARSITFRLLPQAKIPGTEVWRNRSVTAPLLPGSRDTPAWAAISFSGIRPTERRRVSQSTRCPVPGMGRPAPSTWLSSTPSSRLAPKIRVTVVWRWRGMPKS